MSPRANDSLHCHGQTQEQYTEQSDLEVIDAIADNKYTIMKMAGGGR